LISIIASEEAPTYEGFVKFQSNKELKEFYLDYHNMSIKCKSPPTEAPQKQHNVTSHVPQAPTVLLNTTTTTVPVPV
jgi:hypothetical protein